MKIGFLSCRSRALSFSSGALLLCATLPLTFTASADNSPPLKLALFDFELEDFSAGGSLLARNPANSEKLQRVTDEARRLIAESGRYSLVDVSSAGAEPVKAHALRNCDGCDARYRFEAWRRAILCRGRERNQPDGIHGAVSDPRRPDRQRHSQQGDGSADGCGLFLGPRRRLADQEPPAGEPRSKIAVLARAKNLA